MPLGKSFIYANSFSSGDGFNLYTNKPDCFKRAANLIRVSCGDLETDEEERIKGSHLQPSNVSIYSCTIS